MLLLKIFDTISFQCELLSIDKKDAEFYNLLKKFKSDLTSMKILGDLFFYYCFIFKEIRAFEKFKNSENSKIFYREWLERNIYKFSYEKMSIECLKKNIEPVDQAKVSNYLNLEYNLSIFKNTLLSMEYPPIEKVKKTSKKERHQIEEERKMNKIEKQVISQEAQEKLQEENAKSTFLYLKSKK
jgi:hypothetical protein